MEATRQEQIETAGWWRKHRNGLQSEGHLDHDASSIFASLMNPDNIGFGEGQFRPGELGQWDVFFFAQQKGFGRDAATSIAGLSNVQVREMLERLEIESACFNPDDPNDVREYHRLKTMTSEELDDEIVRLEGELAAAQPSA